MQKTIHVVGLGCGDKGEITLRTLEILKSSTVFIRTLHHPAAEILKDYNIAFTSFDTLYDNAENFEQVYEQIVKTLAGRREKNVCYAVPGSAVFAERTVQMLCKSSGIDVKIVPAVSFLDGIFSALKIDGADSFKLLDALQLSAQAPDVFTTNIVCQLYDRQTASDAKLALMEYYPDETQVILVSAASGERETVTKCRLFEIDRINHIGHMSSLVIPPQNHMQLRRDIRSLREVVRKLRSEDGCPWDKAQTHESLTPYVIEEAYEVVDAISKNDPQELCEELGDLLLQIMLHAKIAEEDGLFTFSDVVDAIGSKMINRHPHVFGGYQLEGDLLDMWDEIKTKEHHFETHAQKMHGIAKSLPALIYAHKIGARAAKSNFDFAGADQASEKITEELHELRAAYRSSGENRAAAMSDEAGDLLFSVVNTLRLMGVSSEDALKSACAKFINRFEEMESKIITDGRDIANMSAAELDFYWKTAKKS